MHKNEPKKGTSKDKQQEEFGFQGTVREEDNANHFLPSITCQVKISEAHVPPAKKYQL